MMHVLGRAATALTLALAVNAFPSTSDAGSFAYHSALCHGMGDDSGLTRSSFNIRNTGTARRQVMCPVVHEVGLRNQTFRVQVFDNHASESVECRYFTNGVWGAIRASAATGRQELALGTYTSATAWTYDGMVHCTLPSGSQVEKYNLNET